MTVPLAIPEATLQRLVRTVSRGDAAIRRRVGVCLREYLAAGDWQGLFGLCDRRDRWTAFRSMRRQLPDGDYWEALRDVFDDTETACLQRDLPRLLCARRPARERFMNERERAHLAELPDMLTVHRGCQEQNREGWSWTLNGNQAAWFATRLRPAGLVVHGTVAKVNVVALLIERGEDEIVVNPHHVTVESVSSIEGTAFAVPPLFAPSAPSRHTA